MIARAAAGAPPFEELATGVQVWRVGTPLRRKYLVGRTIDRILHAGDVYNKVSELDAQSPFDVIETTEGGLDGERLLQHKSFADRMVIQCHGSNARGVVPEGLLSGVHRLDWKWSFRRELEALHLAPRILVATEATRQFLLEHGVDSRKIFLIHHGIDVERFSPPIRPPESGLLEVGFAGRLERRKGIDFIWKVIEAIGPNAGVRFHFKGAVHPSARAEVESNLSLFKDTVIYHDASAPDQMQEYYQSLHVLLQPSRFETFGLVYAEAMACGLVVFAGRQGGGSEIVTDGLTGFLVDPDGEIDDVVQKLIDIVKNPKAFDPMRVRARQEVVNRFSLLSCANNKLAYYLQREN